MTWLEARQRAIDGGGAILVIPIGATEQHGPHLPLDTDSRVAVALAQELARRRPDVVVAPVVAYGSSGEHRDFTGTLSIGRDALEHLLVELVRSADDWHAVVLVCGHGGNATPLRRAVSLLVDEGRRVMAWFPRPPGTEADAHAGRTETSLLLAIAPELVHLDRAAPGATEALSTLAPTLRTAGVGAVSPNGILGDPTGASVEEGNHLLAILADDLARSVSEWLGESKD